MFFVEGFMAVKEASKFGWYFISGKAVS